jgi:hypothetical protein
MILSIRVTGYATFSAIILAASTLSTASAAIVTVGPGGTSAGYQFGQVSEALQYASAGDTIHAKARTVDGARFLYDSFDLSQAADGVSFVWGNSPGVIEVGGNMRVGPNANLEFELAGTDNSRALSSGRVQYDTVYVYGTFRLEGLAAVTLFGGFVPTVGDQFELVATDSTISWSGSFLQHFTAPALSGGASWQFSVGTGSIGGESIFATVVPGPGAIALVGAAGIIGSVRRRR